jgi:DNA repair protein RadA/Sms
VEEIIPEQKKSWGTGNRTGNDGRPKRLSEIDASGGIIRNSSGLSELDRVLGGGVVQGEVVLIAGEPGIGKSTLLLQVADSLSEKRKVLYVSGEESYGQIKMRAERLCVRNMSMPLLNETDILTVKEAVEREKPDILIIDSIQTMAHPGMSGAAGSAGQIRETTAILIELAKTSGIPVFLIGHITKEGNIAGPKVLEHMVDCVLYFEGERHGTFRLLRTIKNRFGSTDEIGVFEMRDTGLTEIKDAANYFIGNGKDGAIGTCLTVVAEGTRCLIMEIQALSVFSPMVMPRRVASGVDLNKLSLLAAVLEKSGGLNMRNQEIYVKLAGGFRVTEPAVDLACAMAITGSFKNKPIPSDTVIIGEVGLNGNIRPVNRMVQRLKEARKLGFTKAVIPPIPLKGTENEGMEILYTENISDAIKKLFD